jgi:hypothetical protein
MSRCWPSGIEVARRLIVIRDFGGSVTSEDPYDVPPRTVVQQVNDRSVSAGRGTRGRGESGSI